MPLAPRPSFLSTTYNACWNFLSISLQAMTSLYNIIMSIMQSACLALRCLYEKAFYNQEQRTVRQADRYYNNNQQALKKIFFRLGAMDVTLDMTNFEAVSQKMDEESAGSELFNNDKKRTTLNACEPHFDELNIAYQAGKAFLSKLEEEVKVYAQGLTLGTAVPNHKIFVEIFLESKSFSPEEQDLLAIIVQKYLSNFEEIFKNSLPKEEA